MRTMMALTRCLVAIIACFFLVLPPGACGYCFNHTSEDVSTSQPTCCHKAAATQSKLPSKAPATPEVNCCCAHDDVVPHKSVNPPSANDIAILLINNSVLAVSSASRLPQHQPVLVASGSYLHVLLCVWLC
ncbi:hypothetical protein BH10PLA2_BH10PLA2_25620 [soil metagenome]